jgi:hypothetical protein
MAIKGCSRQMIVLNGTGSSMFETAYFIIKNDADMHRCSHGDMMREANRIIEENTFPVCSEARRFSKVRYRWLFFAAGVLLGASLIGIIWLLYAFSRSLGA